MDYHTLSPGVSATLARRQHAKRATLGGDQVFQPQQQADGVAATAALGNYATYGTPSQHRGGAHVNETSHADSSIRIFDGDGSSTVTQTARTQTGKTHLLAESSCYDEGAHQPGNRAAGVFDDGKQQGGELGKDASFGLEMVRRRQRHYQLQSVVRRLTAKMRHTVVFTNKQTGKKESKEAPYRVTQCLWSLNPGEMGVTVHKTNKGAAYSGLQVCGSVWHCPVCAARITNERRKEIAAALVAAQEQGYKPVLVTLTARHHAHTALESQLEAMTEAHRALWRGSPAQRFKERFKVLGFIRNLEVTHAKQNGWHPHIHEIVFVPQDVELGDFARQMRRLWETAAKRQGLSLNKHGFHATDANSRVADYLAKFGREPGEQTRAKWQNGWNEADELSRWHTKRAKVERGMEDHLTPWQLLDYAATGDDEAGKLFKVYARVFHGRRQIHWSDHLRKKLGLGQEVTDQEAAEQEEEGKQLLEVFLSQKQWDVVRGNDARAELLALVEKLQGVDEIKDACFDLFGFTPLVLSPTLAFMEDNDECLVQIPMMLGGAPYVATT